MNDLIMEPVNAYVSEKYLRETYESLTKEQLINILMEYHNTFLKIEKILKRC